MSDTIKLKVFISYSHEDDNDIKAFITHIAPIKNNGMVEEWYDRKIIAGKEFQDKIDNNLEDADIICLMISARFLSSNACLKEKDQAFHLRRAKGITIIPIILSHCGWLDDKQISTLLALPSDGKPITDFEEKDTGWNDVYKGLKNAIEDTITIKQLKTTHDFADFLQNMELLSKAHSQKEIVHLDDIFIYPELAKYNDMRGFEKNVKLDKLIEEFTENFKIVIAGEDQSGKTTLCKKIFIELRKKNFVPIYVKDKAGNIEGKIKNKLLSAYNQQYTGVLFDKIDKNRIVVIIDDFHLASKKEEHLKDLDSFRNQIVVVDDIFCLNLGDEKLIRSFTQYRILELKSSYRYKLIKKWAELTDRNSGTGKSTDCDVFQNIDKTTEIVNATLGKVFGAGIMPSYPFFILSIISTFETLEKPLDQEITSQGYCYQALIYMYLRKQGVKNDEIDTYINFLSEFAFYFYKERKYEITADDFSVFMEKYVEVYNLPIHPEVLINKLLKTQIISLDSLKNYSFNYLYLYYFFVAKYLEEHKDVNLNRIEALVANLQKDENAYIAVFISHHSKNIAFLEEIILNSMCLFDKYKPATLSKEEVGFFDKQVNKIVEEALPSTDSTPEKERVKRLEKEDLSEQIEAKQNSRAEDRKSEEDDLNERELRRSIKTVEVMGQIIKNRAGSLKKEHIENIFEQAMKTNLRILASFFEIIQSEISQKEIVAYISTRLENHIAETLKKEGNEKKKPPSREQLERLSEEYFWNANFIVVYGMIDKIVHSLGSNNLIAIVEKVCNSENTPASFLIKHGILMWYNKNLQVDNIASELVKKDFSEIARKVMKFMVVNHCAIHPVNYKDKQKIENKIGISGKKLLANELKKA